MFERNEFSDAARERKNIKEWDLNDYTHLTVCKVNWFDDEAFAGMSDYYLSYVRFDKGMMLPKNDMPQDFHDELAEALSRGTTLYTDDEEGTVFGWDYLDVINPVPVTKSQVIKELESNARIIESIRQKYMGK